MVKRVYHLEDRHIIYEAFLHEFSYFYL